MRTDIELVKRRESDDDRWVRALGLHVLDEAREAPEDVEERDRCAQGATRAAEEDVRVDLNST